MSKKNQIEHNGVIKEKNGNKLLISIAPISACASCGANGTCSEANTAEKEIEVFDFDDKYEVGERVDVFYAQTLGFKALFLGYILPFLILLIILIIVFSVTDNEGIAGISSILILVPYYLALYLTKDKIRKQFEFQIKKRSITNKFVFQS